MCFAAITAREGGDNQLLLSNQPPALSAAFRLSSIPVSASAETQRSQLVAPKRFPKATRPAPDQRGGTDAAAATGFKLHRRVLGAELGLYRVTVAPLAAHACGSCLALPLIYI